MTLKWIVPAAFIAMGIATPAMAECSTARANAMAQDFAGLVKQKMTAKPDEMGDLASEFGDVMAEAGWSVTDRTCTRLDALVRKARAL